jgi:hypothetical protein
MILVSRKRITARNFAAGRIIDRRTHHNLLRRDKNKHYVTSYVMDYNAMSHARALPHSYISYLKRRKLLSE